MLELAKAIHSQNILLPLSALVVLLSIPFTRALLASITNLFSGFSDLVIWGMTVKSGWDVFAHAVLGLTLTMIVMVLIWDTFLPVGRLLGRLMSDHPRIIEAYSANVAGQPRRDLGLCWTLRAEEIEKE